MTINEELEQFLDYLNAKVEDVYKQEATNAIKEKIKQLKNGEKI